jgi:hypothetical protein
MQEKWKCHMGLHDYKERLGFYLSSNTLMLINSFVFPDKRFDILTINQHLSTYLDIRELAVPDLGAPEPFGGADLFD